MRTADLLQALAERTVIGVGPPGDDAEDDVAADSALASHEAALRLEFPGEPPPFSIACGRWALRSFAFACQAIAYREIDVAMLACRFAVECPPAPPASRHYSVDVVFRLLPDLWRLARAVSEQDPLMNHLRTLATTWPLSSVGVPNVVGCDVSVIRGHAGLLRMYADRVIAWQDVSRLDDPHVRAAIREAIGHFDALAPTIAAALRMPDATLRTAEDHTPSRQSPRTPETAP